uniref:branched-chain-amino-acid transaminase n=1 Tax=Clytia hemisphaerica TaxID=252671 RepID=A0A7M6DMQ0_9CNID
MRRAERARSKKWTPGLDKLTSKQKSMRVSHYRTERIKKKMVVTISIRNFLRAQKLNKVKGALSIASRSFSEIRYNDLKIHQTTTPREKPSADSKLVFGKQMADHMLVAEWTIDNGWDIPSIVPYGPLAIPPSASVLHYGIEVFEGMKAYKCTDGSIQLFRPEENMKRLFASAERLSLPTFDKEEVLKCIAELVRVDQDWIPDCDSSSLYIRPTIISTEVQLGLITTQEVSNPSHF